MKTEGGITVRQATAEDAAALARLNAAFDNGDFTPEELAQRLDRCATHERVFLAEITGWAVGFACLRLLPVVCSDNLYAELTELFVEAGYRRQGIGKALIHAVEAAARSAGANELFLMTGFKNTGAHHFYHTVGYSLRCLTMHKPLIAA